MNRSVIVVLAGVLAVFLTACCPSVCGTFLNINFVDEAGQPVEPSVGTVSLNGGAALSVVCPSQGASPDGGPGVAGVSCQGSVLVLMEDTLGVPLDTVDLTMADRAGRRFAGRVPFTLQTMGRGCGGPCRTGTATLTLR